MLHELKGDDVTLQAAADFQTAQTAFTAAGVATTSEMPATCFPGKHK